VLGDALDTHMSQLSNALAGVIWDGPAANDFVSLFNQVLAVLQNLPEAAWQIGAAINAYGDQAVASEKKYAQEQHAALIQEIIAMVLGIFGVLGAALGPVLPVLGAVLGALVAPLTAVVGFIAGALGASDGIAIVAEIAAGVADTVAQIAWTTAVEDKMLGEPFKFPKPDTASIVQDSIFIVGGTVIGHALGKKPSAPPAKDPVPPAAEGAPADPAALPGGVPAVAPPRVDPPTTNVSGDVSLTGGPLAAEPPLRVEVPANPDRVDSAAPAPVSAAGPVPVAEPARLPSPPHDAGAGRSAGSGRYGPGGPAASGGGLGRGH
jgi:hypothetical protein